MSDFMNRFFGPLDRSSCIYFRFLTIFFFALLVFALFTELLFVVKNFKQLNLRIFSNGILLLFNIFLVYFANRLLYSMCDKSLAIVEGKNIQKAL
jgi:hypothetical protein